MEFERNHKQEFAVFPSIKKLSKLKNTSSKSSMIFAIQIYKLYKKQFMIKLEIKQLEEITNSEKVKFEF